MVSWVASAAYGDKDFTPTTEFKPTIPLQDKHFLDIELVEQLVEERDEDISPPSQWLGGSAQFPAVFNPSFYVVTFLDKAVFYKPVAFLDRFHVFFLLYCNWRN